MKAIFFVAVGLLLGLVVAPVWAGTFHDYVRPNDWGLVGNAGEILADGRIAHGTKFSARRIATGQYEIRIDRGWDHGCGALVANTVRVSGIVTVVERACAPTEDYLVTIYNPNATNDPMDAAFHFIVAQEE